MHMIEREINRASRYEYDLIIIGGGIYGVMVALESTRQGLKSLLLERDDFGEHTSFNSLRIIHGGLRYLQSLNLQRYRESVNERKWFLDTFPNHVKPLPCIMPLYGKGLKRNGVFRVALNLNELLSIHRNVGVREDRKIFPGRVVSPDQTHCIFPGVDTKGLQGGAVWYDAIMETSQRLLIDIIRWSCSEGATALNYVEAAGLLVSENKVLGVSAIDRINGERIEFMSDVVVNAAGPWCRCLAGKFHRDVPKLFRPSLAWNVLLNKEQLSSHALAVSPKKPDGQTYFFVPWRGKILAGTGHRPWNRELGYPKPSTVQLQEFLDDINMAVPDLNAKPDDIGYVFSGLLPVTEEGGVTLTDRETILDHGRFGGPLRLYSISGVKFTTARLVAEKTLNIIYPNIKKSGCSRKPYKMPVNDSLDEHGILNILSDSGAVNIKWKNALNALVREEAVLHLDDLMLRRTNLMDNPEEILSIGSELCEIFDWDRQRKCSELQSLKEKLYCGGYDSTWNN